MGAVGQLVLKAGADQLGEFNITISTFFQSIWMVLKSPVLLVGLVLFGMSFLLWIKVLTKAELSQAYPIVSLSYVIVGIGSAIFFNEPITMQKIMGIGAIVIGVFILNK